MRNLLPVIFLLFGDNALLFGQTPFQKIYTDPLNHYLVVHDVREARDGGILIAGETRDSLPHAMMISTDNQGNLKWAKKYRPVDPAFDTPYGWAVLPTENNGILLSSWKENNASVLGQVLLKTDLSGKPEWSLFGPIDLGETALLSFNNQYYYGGYHFPQERFFFSGISPSGQPNWENLYTAGLFDYYTIFSISQLQTSAIVSLGVEQKNPGGGSLGPDHTVLFKIRQDGEIETARFFEKLFISGLQPLPNGDIAFLAASDGVDWVGVGVMDADFNWKWFKEVRFKKGILLKGILDRQMAVSGDGTMLNCMFFVGKGGRILLRLDIFGNVLEQQVYLPGDFGEAICPYGMQDMLRVSNLGTDRFLFARPNPDGSLPGCSPRYPCGLILVDTMFPGAPVMTSKIAFPLLKPESISASDISLSSADWCYDPGVIHAGFELSDTIICSGETISAGRLFGIKDPEYGISDWSFEGGIPSSGTTGEIKNIRFDDPGRYLIRHIFNVAGCVDTATQAITIGSPAEIELGPDRLLCAGDTMFLSAGPDVSTVMYQWNTGAMAASIQATRSGVYSVTVLDTLGCATQDSMYLTVLSPETVQLGPDTTFCQGSRLQISPISPIAPNVQYQWNTGAGGPGLEVSEPGTYILQVKNQACTYSDTIAVGTKDCPACRVFAPNVFAPESAGENQLFKLFSECNITQQQLQIFDRWGNLAYRSFDVSGAWDGVFKGKPLPPGVYVFVADLDMLSPLGHIDKQRITGNITLVR